jgi:hypothetical protein
MRFRDLAVYGVMAALAVLPDPTDIFDLGTPFFEVALAVGYYWFIGRHSKK